MDTENKMLEKLKEYFANTPREEIDKAWAKTNELDLIGPTFEEYLDGLNETTYIYTLTDNIMETNLEQYTDEGLRIITPHEQDEQELHYLLILGQVEEELPSYKNIETFYGSTATDMADELYEAQFGLVNSIINPDYKSPLF